MKKRDESEMAVEARFDFGHASADQIAAFLADITLLAAPAIMDVYAGSKAVAIKRDGSPVTLADERAEAVILAALRERASPIAIVAEEAAAAGAPLEIGESFLLIDPLDGTKEFISCNGEFTVNIALIRGGAPCAGAVLAPALGRIWFGGDAAFSCAITPGAKLPRPEFWRAIAARTAGRELTALASRSHCDPATEAFLGALPVAHRRAAGSSLKFCVLAEGEADVYPRFAPTMEWDTAAGHAVLRASGGVVLNVEGGELLYGKTHAGLRNGGFIAWGDPKAAFAFGSVKES